MSIRRREAWQLLLYKIEGDDDYRDIDVEDPMPGQIIDKDPANDGPKDGTKNDGQAYDRH
ncbi:hypothetical protein D3C86_2206360 [compost metagenome]